MIRHFFLFAAAPGRLGEAEQALVEWLTAAAGTAEFRGGAALRARAGEFGDVQPPIGLTYDVDSRDAGRAMKAAMAAIPNPMSTDVVGVEPPDQGAILFSANQADHQHDPLDDHHHDDSGHAHLHVSPDAVLTFDRGGGLLCRLMHAHFETVMTVSSSPSDATAER